MRTRSLSHTSLLVWCARFRTAYAFPISLNLFMLRTLAEARMLAMHNCVHQRSLFHSMFLHIPFSGLINLHCHWPASAVLASLAHTPSAIDTRYAGTIRLRRFSASCSSVRWVSLSTAAALLRSRTRGLDSMQYAHVRGESTALERRKYK